MLHEAGRLDAQRSLSPKMVDSVISDQQWKPRLQQRERCT